MKYISSVFVITDILISKIQHFSTVKYYSFYAAFILSVVALILCYPKYEKFNTKLKEVVPQGLQQQYNNPFTPIDLQKIENKANHPGQVSHMDKRALRITVPLIGNIFGFGVTGGIVLQHLTTFSLIILIIKYFKNNFNATTGLLVAFFFNGLSTIQWGFYDFFFYDGVAWFLLFASLVNPLKILNLPILLFAYFTDERALVCSPLLILLYLYEPKNNKIKSTLFLLLSWIAYVAIRLFLSYRFELYTGDTGISFEIFKSNLHVLPLAILSTYEMGFFIILIALLILKLKKDYFKFVGFIIFSAIIMGASMFVLDLTRSIGYGFIGLVFCLFVFLKEENIKFANRIILLMGIFNLAFPNYYFMNFQPYIILPFLRLFTE